MRHKSVDPRNMTLPQTGWGPDLKRSALSFTFDNLGEAADLEFNKWPTSDPVGNHYTVTEVLPALLDKFDNGKVTFFIEAWNAETYPAMLQKLAAHGHDVALHGWRHELWGDLDPERQRNILQRSLAALGQIGLRPCGFRPPGGSVGQDPSALLCEFGFTYYSASNKQPGVEDGIAQIPFAWQHLDGVYLMPGGDAMVGTPIPGFPEAASLEGMQRAFNRAIQESIQKGTHLTLVFHPWLLGQDPERLRVLFELYDSAAQNPQLWVAPCRDVANWYLKDLPRQAAPQAG
jgi:peptidoglycan/xylan/chitin deacetylase (PgdA/CDA1 family)